MLALVFLIKSLNVYLLIAFPSESVALFASSVGLVGVTMILRRVFRRRDEKIEEVVEIGKSN